MALFSRLFCLKGKLGKIVYKVGRLEIIRNITLQLIGIVVKLCMWQ